MAGPISFTVKVVDPQQELMRRVEAAPREHAEALLAMWELLETAHEQGMLELAQGLMGGRDAIAGKLAEAGKSEAGVAVIRNAIALGKVLAAVDPMMLQRVAEAFEADRVRVEAKAPGVWTLVRRMFSKDVRRGLGFVMAVLGRVGKSSGK